ncbi:MAG: hypothetical protein IKS42_11735 [Oscillospiraceae bacterium]|nr:hypothetical protein [Oscillospiraceae bacterium]
MKRNKTAPALAAAMLLLTGCIGRKETDLSKRYPDYFKYSFGEDSSFKFGEREKGDPSRDVYYLSYSFPGGVKRDPILPESRIEIIPYKESVSADKKTEDEYYLSYLELLLEDEVSDIFRLGFSSLLKPHFDSLAETSVGLLQFGSGSKDGSIFVSVLPLFNVGDKDEACREQAMTLYQPGTGLKICEQTMESLAQNDQLAVTVLVRLSEDADAAAYTAQFEALTEEFLAINPQNYSLILKQKTGSGEDETAGSRTLSAAYGILGEPIDYAAHAAAHGEGYLLINDMRESWLANSQLKS